MGNQVIGITLLVAAVAVAIFVGFNYDKVSGFRIPNMPSFRAVDYVPSISMPEYKENQQDTVSQTIVSPIVISSIRPQSDGGYAEIVVTADPSVGDLGIDIAGWKIGSSVREFTIPGAQDVYTFGGSQSKLIIRPWDELRIFSGTSPRGNFRINKCIGYFSEYGDFNPPLENNCPVPYGKEISNLTNACRSYIASIPTCTTPKNVPIPSQDVSCYDYLSTINYEGCVSRHRLDPDFLTRQVRVWGGGALNYFNPDGDIIKIYDRGGILVSQFIYLRDPF